MNSVKIDDAALKNSLNKIDDEDEIKKIIYKAIVKGAKTLQQKTKSVYKSYMPTASNKMIQGVKVKNDKAYTESTVHIMGDYRNKWFEKGTKERRKKVMKLTIIGANEQYIKRMETQPERLKRDIFLRMLKTSMITRFKT